MGIQQDVAWLLRKAVLSERRLYFVHDPTDEYAIDYIPLAEIEEVCFHDGRPNFCLWHAERCYKKSSHALTAARLVAADGYRPSPSQHL